MDRDLEFTVMNIVIDSGNCRSSAMEAIALAKQGQFEEARKALDEADENILKAHRSQTDLIQREAGGEPIEISLLLVHSQDHLMTSMTVKDLAKEFVDLYESMV